MWKNAAFISIFLFMASCEKKMPVELDTTGTCISDVVVATITGESGIIRLLGNEWVIDAAKPNGTDRYFACNLPEDYKQANKPIVFDAKIYEVPPNVRVIGSPITITKIF